MRTLTVLLSLLVIATAAHADSGPGYFRAGWVPGVGAGMSHYNPATGRTGASSVGWLGVRSAWSGPLTQGGFRIGPGGYGYTVTGPNGGNITRGQRWFGPGFISITGPQRAQSPAQR